MSQPAQPFGFNGQIASLGEITEELERKFYMPELTEKPICDPHRHSQFYRRAPFNKPLCNLSFTYVGM
jgi:hypothetical protein